MTRLLVSITFPSRHLSKWWIKNLPEFMEEVS